MTNKEQTILNLKKLKSFHNGSYGADIDRAIKSLEQEPCDKCVYSTKDGYCQYDDITETIPPLEPCEDVISREDALMALTGEWTEPTDELIHRFIKRIKNLPPVKPQPRTGHWIMPVQDDGMSDPIYYQVRCSECGFDLDPQTWHVELHQHGADKYCPKCGAKMESEDKE